MRRTTLNFIVDLIGFVDLLLLAATGAIMKWGLPPGSGGGHGYGFRGGRGAREVKELLGLGRHDWGDIHFLFALLFLILILVHVILHWIWIKTCFKSFFSRPRAAPCDLEDESRMQ